MNRRFFIKSSGIAIASIGVGMSTPSFLQRAVLGQERSKVTGGRRKTLIAIFQRGAVDGLNVVVPYGEHSYYDVRPSIAIPKPDGGAEAAINLDGFFGLHPALDSFKPLWDSKRLAIVHACGSPDNTRSHFDAQDYMESGTPGVKGTTDGWLNRYLQSTDDPKNSPFRAVAMGPNMPRSMQGKASAIAMNNISDFTIRAGGGEMGQAVQGGFEAMYAQTVNDALRGAGKETFDAMKLLKRVNPAQYQPASGVIYPRGALGDRL